MCYLKRYTNMKCPKPQYPHKAHPRWVLPTSIINYVNYMKENPLIAKNSMRL